LTTAIFKRQHTKNVYPRKHF